MHGKSGPSGPFGFAGWYTDAGGVSMDDLEAYAAEVAAKMGNGSDVADQRTDQRESQRAALIASVASGTTLADAARAAGVSRKTVYQWRNEDAEFGAEFDAARDAGLQRAEVRIAEMTSDCRIKAVEVLHDAMCGEMVNRQQLTAAIFTAKAKLGWIETVRQENVDIVPILDDVPADA